MAYNIFISYSTKDMKIVRKVVDILISPQVRVFMAEDSIDPGEDLDNKIIKNIKDCDLFLLLWSGNSKRSKYVEKEMWIARGLKKKILPLILKRRLKLPGFIENTKYLPIYKDLEMNLQKLRSQVQSEAKNKSINEFGQLVIGIGAVVTFLYLISRE